MKRFVKISAVVHAAVLLGIIIWPSVFSPKYKHRIQPVHTVEIISPQEITPPKPAEKPKYEPKPVTKKEKTPVRKTQPILKPKVPPLTTPTLEEKLSKRLQEPKKLAAKSKPTPSQESPSSTPQLKTTISSTLDSPFQWYLDLIQSKIAASWHQPQMVIAKQYSSMISFIILKDGQVRNIKVKRPSGMVNFDKSALQAIELAQPLPPLPAGYKHPQLVVNVEFNLER